MAQQQGGSGGGNADNSMAPVWITALLFFALYIIWRVAHQHIVWLVFKINLFQAEIIRFFSKHT